MLSYSEHMRQSAREYLTQVLTTCNWNARLAAQMAKKNRTDFYKLIRRYGINRPTVAHRGRWQEFGL
jgi:two-component system response regulator GlrR